MNTKIVYQCDIAGLYIGPTEAFESPLEPGVFSLPAGCVEAEPPEAEAGKVAVWTGEAWKLVADHRGEVWYLDGDAATIDFVGDPTERGYSATAPEPTLDDLRAAKIAAINAAADALIATGAPVDGDLHVALDDGSRADLTAMASTAIAAAAGSISWPDSYSQGWISAENVRIPLATAAAGLTLAASVGNWYAALVQHRRDLKDAALDATDAAALDAIDLATGWPG